MISCTEFIPSYNELFTYIEDKYGRDEVTRFWEYLFEPNGTGIPLINYVKKYGIRGCFLYWAGTLNEEAADFTMYVNEKRGFFMIDMHRCPSKGRLLKLKEDIGIVPYHDYCLHCDSYRAAVEKVGLKYIYNFAGVDKASCSVLIYDPKLFDGRVIIDDDTEIMKRNASDNEYFHLDFHSSMNMGIHYLGEKYDFSAVKEYLIRYSNNVYQPLVNDMKIRGLVALKEKIEDTYKKEKANDAIEITMSDDEKILEVKVLYCPAVKYLRSTGRTVSKWYRYTTEIVMQTLADSIGVSFLMDEYDENDGSSSYRFLKEM